MLLGVMGALPALFLDWFAVAENWSRVKYITKPLAMGVIMGWLIIANSTRPHTTAVWLILGLFFAGQVLSMAGDIFLLLPRRFFLWGLLSFLGAHFCYIASLQGWQARLDTIFILCICLVAFTSSLFSWMLLKRFVQSGRGKKLGIPVAIYIFAISLMLLSAISTFFQPGWRPFPASLVLLGGLMFFASDALLSYDRFMRPIAQGRLKVRVLYHLGQFSLAIGLTLQIWMSKQ